MIHKLDEVHLYNLTEKVLWSELDRWNYYEDPLDPIPPSYSFYTGFTLKWTFLTFFVIMIFHALSMLLVKIFTSTEFKEDRNTYEKLLHVIENLNSALPYRDWDEDDGKSTTKKEFAGRSQKTEREMILSQLVNIGISMIMLIPIWFTGQKKVLKHFAHSRF